MTDLTYHLYILLTAIALDLWIGDPKWLPHPVVMIGKGISILEKRWNKGYFIKGKGIGLVFVIVGGTCLLAYGIVRAASLLHPIAAFLLEVYIVFSTLAIKGLQKAAYEVWLPLAHRDLIMAREKLGWIVGRDTKDLPISEVTRGTVETVAENTVDAIISPMFWALIGGGPFALAYRAANTLDSMVGYKNETYKLFGWASARFDDVVNWLPARLTAASMWLGSWFVLKSRQVNGIKALCRDARKHPSPNAGLPEAMCAGLLGVRLGGRNTYGGVPSYREEMGDPLRPLEPEDIRKSVLYMHLTWIVFLTVTSVIVFWI